MLTATVESSGQRAQNEFMSRDKREHLVDLLKDFDTAMLVTHTAGEAIRARPMHLVQVQEDGSVLFVTSKQGGAAKEISRTADVAVTVQGKSKFASLSG